MKRLETALPGVCLIQPEVLLDARGFFLESYHQAKLAALGITDHFVQDNHSRSTRCRVVEGEVLDVAVDIRLGSPHFGMWISAVLSAKNHSQIYVPTGFAHGFLVLSESAQFLYKCSDFYDPANEHGIVWNDPDINIAWGIADPMLSEKDQNFMRLAEIPRQFLPQYQ
ncbi:MAG: dTDP-4-dehydrorhamnose 3,5-epimerase [Acidobacteria bacterium]|nr:MAG: dTDP-4-dehydrorhamnose 3,5-epimerase [Acidobacteriota bacterium]